MTRIARAAATVVLPGLIMMILANPTKPADAVGVGRLPCSYREIFIGKSRSGFLNGIIESIRRVAIIETGLWA